MLVPGYDAEGKLWTVQYIKEDGTKRFAKESRKHGCFHVVGAANAAAALQKIGLSPVVVIAEGYATAASIAKHAKAPAIAAFDSGNLLAVATAIRERYKDKQIIIAGDDDHGRENNPGRTKALEAAAAVKGLAVFPQLSTEQREQGFTDFNDLARQDPELLTRQFEDVIRRGREQSPAQGIELGPTSRAEAERQLYRTTTVGQLVAALVESRDQTDIRHVFEHHEGGTQGFEIACQSLGISKDDWNHANNVAGFHALVAIIGNKLGLPRHDPAAEQARREEVAAIIKSPVRAATQSVELARAI
jgi:hypothetical protein